DKEGQIGRGLTGLRSYPDGAMSSKFVESYRRAWSRDRSTGATSHDADLLRASQRLYLIAARSAAVYWLVAPPFALRASSLNSRGGREAGHGSQWTVFPRLWMRSSW